MALAPVSWMISGALEAKTVANEGALWAHLPTFLQFTFAPQNQPDVGVYIPVPWIL